MPKKRKWPTVPEILRVAVLIIDTPWETTMYRTNENGPLIHVHRATRMNLLKSLTGWTKTTVGERTIYRPSTGPNTPPS